MQGWIKLHRRITEWEWYQDGNTVRLFIHLLLKANHKPKQWQGLTIEAGQVVTGRKQLAVELGLSEQQIRTSINRLKSTSNLTIKSTNKFSIITLCNYRDFQDVSLGEQPANQPANQPASQPTNNRQLTTNKNDKNDKKEEFKKTKAKKVSDFPCPEGVRPESWDGFIEMRKKIKKQLTPHAVGLLVNKLKKINYDTGQDPSDILDQSTMNSWQGVFPLKEQQSNTGVFNGQATNGRHRSKPQSPINAVQGALQRRQSRNPQAR